MATPLPKPGSRAPITPDYLSPEVGPDGRVTIRYFHPSAREVWCEAEWSGWQPIPMAQNACGIWECASPPLAPDIYEYSLFADGARVVDYQNPESKNRFTHLVCVPGGRAHEPRNVPHGVVRQHWYDSPVTGTLRRLHVYTPPGYEEEPARTYPVLYLLHGAGEDDDGWVRIGKLNFLLDNLIAQGRALPMVIAMPHGHVLGTNWKVAREEKVAAFTRDFHECVIPLVERLYRIGTGTSHRAMAGLSMGGGQTIAAGLTRPGTFSAFGLFSSGLWPEITPAFEQALPALRETPPQLLWIGIGRADFLFGHCAALRRTLDSAGLRYIYHEDDTGHSWRTWRDYFERFAPLLFRDTT